MKVYVATIEYDWEGSEVVGVFSTRERAQEEAEKRRTCDLGNGRTYLRGDRTDVVEWEVEE